MTALFLAPHNDDEILFGSFTLLRHQPHVVICFRSFRMADPHYPGGQPVDYETRERETQAAMDLLGCDWTQLVFRDDQEGQSYALKRWFELNKEWSFDGDPDVVFAPAYEEGGQFQHNEVALAAQDAFGERVVQYLTYTAEGRSSGGREVEFEPEWVELKLRALACYRSQILHPVTRHWFFDAPVREYVV